MINTNATSFRKDVYKMLDTAVQFNERYNISTKNGNAILISEEEYRGLIETLNIMANKDYYNELLESLNEPIEEAIPLSEVDF